MNVTDLHMLFASGQIPLSTVWQDVDPNSTKDDVAEWIVPSIASKLSRDPSFLSGIVAYGTTSTWQSDPSFVPLSGQIIIWADRSVSSYLDPQTGEPAQMCIPGIKVGDGKAANVDLPFMGDDMYERVLQQLQDHLVSENDRKSWDHKITIGKIGYSDANDYENTDGVSAETLIITRD